MKVARISMVIVNIVIAAYSSFLRIIYSGIFQCAIKEMKGGGGYLYLMS
jgi:hypothetical protein